MTGNSFPGNKTNSNSIEPSHQNISNNDPDTKDLTNNESILSSTVAKKVLPYLTLDLLSEQEKTEIIRLSNAFFDSVQKHGLLHNHNIGIRSFVDHHTKDDNKQQSFRNEAYKLFAGCFLEHLNSEKCLVDKNDAVALALCHNHIFSSCEFEGQLELLSISERSDKLTIPTRLLYRTMIEDERFREKDENAFLEVLKKASPIKQLQLLPVMGECKQFCRNDGQKTRDDFKKTLLDFWKHLGTTPDEAKKTKIIDDITNLKTNDEAMIENIESAFDFLLLDKKTTPLIRMLANELKNAPSDSIIYNKRYTFDGYDAYEADLLNTARHSMINKKINEKIGLNLTDISLDAQVQLLKFMTEAGDTRFNSLCSALHNVKPELRLKLAENFLATDFGDDFGDSLLTIASSESLSDEDKERVLDSISSCRESISSITSLYQEIDDGEFAKEYTRAANERLTDAIMAFSQIAENGSATADLGWAGNISLNYDDAIKALEYEMKSLEIISGTFSDVTSGVKGAYAERFMSPDESHNRSFYNLFSPNHGYVLLYTRPEGAGEFDPSTEYGKYRNPYSEEDNVGVEASISMIVDPIEPFELPVPYRPTKRVFRMLGENNNLITRMMNKVSAIRLDREGRAPNSNPNDTGRNPTNPIGTISVDLAAILDGEDMPSGKIARLFSVGNKLRAEKRGESEFSLNHNTNWFNQDRYGTSDGFSKLVDYLDSQMAMLCAIHPPKLREGFTGSKRRSRGEKARRAA